MYEQPKNLLSIIVIFKVGLNVVDGVMSQQTITVGSVSILRLSNATLQIMGFVLIVRYKISPSLAHI
jgi:hypothetical protein